ncbi:hypothetical protein AVEN_194525-1 [Araneus ventricosus]|uniref:Uncharacterized protein n=1 Tax=Araneus ventricosus TaxID=182803 RepID=A0A4Y2A6B1_ARAVE|nr:hypothetical protein AVEN_194525-1 [Araneus ventricosus]
MGAVAMICIQCCRSPGTGNLVSRTRRVEQNLLAHFLRDHKSPGSRQTHLSFSTTSNTCNGFYIQRRILLIVPPSSNPGRGNSFRGALSKNIKNPD